MTTKGLWPRERRAAELVLVAAAAALLLLRLGAVDFAAPDEPRYGQIASELHDGTHGARGWLLLHLAGEPYTQKPPLYFWLVALTGHAAGGVSESVARLPSALSGVATVALVARFASGTLGPATGVLGGALLLTANEFAKRARRAQLDVLLTLFETLALIGFWRLDRGLGSRRSNLFLFHGGMGLAVLTKGPVGFVVPALVVAAYLLWERRLRDLKRAFPAWGLALALGPGIAWLAATLLVAPSDFFEEAVFENLIGRFFAGTSHARPVYYYLVQFPLDLLPASLLAPLAWRAGRTGGWARSPTSAASFPGAARMRRFLLAWVAAPLVFFTLSTGKRGLYLLPVYPGAALLLADALVREVRAQGAVPRLAAGAASVLGVALAVAAGALLVWPPLGDPVEVRLCGALVLATVGLGFGVWRWASERPHATRVRIAALVATAWLVEGILFQVGFPALDRERSPRPIAEAAAAETRPGEPVGLLGDHAMLGGLVYYGKRPIVALKSPESVERFLAEGGRVVVVQESKVERVAVHAAVEERFRVRSGDRTVLVVRALPDGS